MSKNNLLSITIKCPFCSEGNFFEIEKNEIPERRICEHCKRMFLIYKKKNILFYKFETKII
jgi:hypothetical protein